MVFELTSQAIKSFCKERGASVVGIASVDRFTNSPKGHAPDQLLDGAKSVVVMGIRLLPALVDWPNLLKDSELITGPVRQLVAQNYIYMKAGYHVVNQKLEQMALDLALRLEESGQRSLYFPSTYGEYAPIMEQVPGLYAPFSHRHAAVRAGLGEFGMNNLVISPDYGPRIRFISVITRAELTADALLDKKLCLGPKCSLCIKHCKTGALVSNGYGNDVALDINNQVDKDLCYRKHGEAGCIGACLRVCPVGKT